MASLKGGPFCAPIGGPVCTPIDSQLESQLESQLRSQLRSQLYSQLRSQLGSQLESQLGSQLYSQLYSQNLYESGFLWGSMDLYWLAFYRFGQKIGARYDVDVSRRFDIMEGISQQCAYWWPFDGIVIASEKPRVVRWDDNRLLHGETGPSVEFSDGYALHTWHGQAIPAEWVTGKPPSPVECLTWRNLDQRAAACEIVGWHNILDEVGARTIDDSGDPAWGKLVEVDLPDNGPQRMLDAMCGTGRRFALLTTMNVNTVDEAQSELHGGIPAHILRNSVERT
ncbi:DUF6745 domain-containing protein [Sphingobium naphthae]|uniref:DUF6745 domain-containing protein n=1 Tax=Sphingobium naphthae TaxID=1886786 RepID=UPI00374939BC